MHPIWTLLRCAAVASLVFFIAAWATSALAQPMQSSQPMPPSQPRALVLEANEKITLDGRLEESAWQRAPLHERFVQFLPTDRPPPPAGYRTTVQVIAQADALVIGVRAYDPSPQDIRAPLTCRDQVKRDRTSSPSSSMPRPPRRAVRARQRGRCDRRRHVHRSR